MLKTKKKFVAEQTELSPLVTELSLLTHIIRHLQFKISFMTV